MKNLLLICFVLILQVTTKEQLAFVFELVRHGARAPMISEPHFTVGKGELT